MKKALSLVLTLVMVFAILSVGVSASAESSYSNPGTYTASAVGKNGDVTLTVTFNLPINDRIIASMSKDWYRYRQRNTENYEIPIFF